MLCSCIFWVFCTFYLKNRWIFPPFYSWTCWHYLLIKKDAKNKNILKLFLRNLLQAPDLFRIYFYPKALFMGINHHSRLGIFRFFHIFFKSIINQYFIFFFSFTKMSS